MFFDEAGFIESRPRPCGWSPKGQVLVAHAKTVPKKVLKLVGMLHLGGVIHTTLGPDEALNSENLARVFVRDRLAHLPPDAVLVLDNASFHGKHFRAMLIKHGIDFIHLPPYCPELNPIELTWSWLKRGREHLSFDAKKEVNVARVWIDKKLSHAHDHAAGWFRHAGYAV